MFRGGEGRGLDAAGSSESARNAGALGFSLGQEDPLKEGTAAQSSVLAWRIPRAEEPGGLQSMGPHRVGHG